MQVTRLGARVLLTHLLYVDTRIVVRIYHENPAGNGRGGGVRYGTGRGFIGLRSGSGFGFGYGDGKGGGEAW
jgi:hypothetical protein